MKLITTSRSKIVKKEIIVTAKTVEEAKNKAAAELGVAMEEIEFTVLEDR